MEVEKISMGDRIRINVYTGEITNQTTGIGIKAKPYPDFIMKIVEGGGIGNYIRSHKSEYELLK
jgi:3-isopropylmalate/(R)-2-methylmalate dehydratase small subunit